MEAHSILWFIAILKSSQAHIANSLIRAQDYWLGVAHCGFWLCLLGAKFFPLNRSFSKKKKKSLCLQWSSFLNLLPTNSSLGNSKTSFHFVIYICFRSSGSNSYFVGHFINPYQQRKATSTNLFEMNSLCWTSGVAGMRQCLNIFISSTSLMK